MANYRTLRNQFIKLSGKEELMFEPGHNGAILIPLTDSKIYIHWVTTSGKLISTHTLSFATLIHDKCKLINGTALPTRIHAISL